MQETRKFQISAAGNGQWLLVWPEQSFGGNYVRGFTGTETFEEAVQLMHCIARTGYVRPYSDVDS